MYDKTYNRIIPRSPGKAARRKGITMSFHSKTNAGRAQKIIDILDLIEASARSNKATDNDVSALLMSAVLKLADMVKTLPVTPSSAPETTAIAVAGRSLTARSDLTLKAAIEAAPRADLSGAMFQLAMRIDTEIFEASR
jgi:hypothetical protein